MDSPKISRALKSELSFPKHSGMGSDHGIACSNLFNSKGRNRKDFPTPQGSQFDLDSTPFASRVVCSDCKVPNTMGSTLRLNPSIPEGWKDKDFPHDKSSIGSLG